MSSISEIKNEFKLTSIEKYPELLDKYADDPRDGVITALNGFRRKFDAYLKEIDRMHEMFHYERLYDNKEYIAGVDEVGRGPLAGPVVTCAVILPKDCKLLYLNDSKQLSAKKRDELYDQIIENCVAYKISVVDHTVIDEINILQATLRAMRESVLGLSVKPDQILVDAVKIPDIDIDQRGIIKGDAKSASIAAASIVAKVTRDRMMEEFDKIYPGFGFASNKGYGSADHIKAIKEIGPCPIHRKTFITNFI